jgi:hypothetical protein
MRDELALAGGQAGIQKHAIREIPTPYRSLKELSNMQVNLIDPHFNIGIGPMWHFIIPRIVLQETNYRLPQT